MDEEAPVEDSKDRKIFNSNSSTEAKMEVDNKEKKIERVSSEEVSIKEGKTEETPKELHISKEKESDEEMSSIPQPKPIFVQPAPKQLPSSPTVASTKPTRELDTSAPRQPQELVKPIREIQTEQQEKEVKASSETVKTSLETPISEEVKPTLENTVLGGVKNSVVMKPTLENPVTEEVKTSLETPATSSAPAVTFNIPEASEAHSSSRNEISTSSVTEAAPRERPAEAFVAYLQDEESEMEPESQDDDDEEVEPLSIEESSVSDEDDVETQLPVVKVESAPRNEENDTSAASSVTQVAEAEQPAAQLQVNKKENRRSAKPMHQVIIGFEVDPSTLSQFQKETEERESRRLHAERALREQQSSVYQELDNIIPENRGSSVSEVQTLQEVSKENRSAQSVPVRVESEAEKKRKGFERGKSTFDF